MPKVSVIMSVYNQKNPCHLERSVRSILDQTLSDLEFLIYDDGSEREDAEVLDKLQGLDRRIRLIRGDGNQGISHGLNTCIRQAKGKYLARMDADDDCLPERLGRLGQAEDEGAARRQGFPEVFPLYPSFGGIPAGSLFESKGRIVPGI